MAQYRLGDPLSSPQPLRLSARNPNEDEFLAKLTDADRRFIGIGDRADSFKDPSESDRLRLIARVLDHAAQTFGQDVVSSWLHTPFRRLANATPIEKMRSIDGASELEEYLTQIDEGMLV